MSVDLSLIILVFVSGVSAGIIGSLIASVLRKNRLNKIEFFYRRAKAVNCAIMHENNKRKVI